MSHISDCRLRNIYLKHYLINRDNLLESYSQLAKSLRETQDFMWDVMIAEWKIATCRDSSFGLRQTVRCERRDNFQELACEKCDSKNMELDHHDQQAEL